MSQHRGTKKGAGKRRRRAMAREAEGRPTRAAWGDSYKSHTTVAWFDPTVSQFEPIGDPRLRPEWSGQGLVWALNNWSGLATTLPSASELMRTWPGRASRVLRSPPSRAGADPWVVIDRGSEDGQEPMLMTVYTQEHWAEVVVRRRRRETIKGNLQVFMISGALFIILGAVAYIWHSVIPD